MLRRWTCCGFALLLALGVVECSADVIGDWEAMRQQQQRHFDEAVSGMKLIEQTRMWELMQMRLENKTLTLRTSLASTNGEGFVRVRLHGVPQFALLRIQGGNDDSPGAPGDVHGVADGVVPSNFQLSIMDYSQPRIINTLVVNSQPTILNIARQTQYPTGYRTIQIMAQMPAADSGPERSLQLVVNDSSNGERPQVNITLEAEDFSAFVQRYPLETNQYLRPLLRELAQEAVFAPDPLVAWQVFSDVWKSEAAVKLKVDAILPSLNEADYRIREHAVLELQELGRRGATALIHLDRRRLTLEQNTRVDRVLAPYTQLKAQDAVRLRSDPGFLLDCLYCEDLALRQAALDRYRDLVNVDPHLDVNASPTARAIAIAVQREKLIAKPTPATTTPAGGSSDPGSPPAP